MNFGNIAFYKKLWGFWKCHQVTRKIRSADIALLVYDFDGVMTDNRVIVHQDGTEAVITNRADGLGINRLRELGIPQLIMSTETNPVVQARARKLGLEVIDSCNDKAAVLCNYCRKNRYDLQRVVFVGNDVNDLSAMRIVGLAVSPADGHPKIRSMAGLITSAKGGEGVVKELSELVSEN